MTGLRAKTSVRVAFILLVCRVVNVAFADVTPDSVRHEECPISEDIDSVQEMSLLQTELTTGLSNHKRTLTVAEYMRTTEVHSPLHGSHMAIFITLTVVLVSFLIALVLWALQIRSKISTPRAPDALKVQNARLGEDSETSAQGRSANPHLRNNLSVVLFFVVGGSLAASSLTVVNKRAMNMFHPPLPPGQPAETGHHHHHKGYVWTLVLIQFMFSAVIAKLAGITGLSKVENLEFRRCLAFFPAAGMFMVTIIAGNAVMNYTNVSTFLTLRSLVPIPCALLETVVYNDPFPPVLSWIALVMTVSGAGLYTMSTGGFQMQSVAWGAIYLICMPIDGLLIKHSITASNLSPWGLVYYNNMLAAVPLVAYVFAFELQDMTKVNQMFTSLLEPSVMLAVLISCATGIAVSFFQLSTRYYISATAFMVLGVVNKFLTVLFNELFLESSSAAALCGLLTTLTGAICWQMTVGGSSVKVRSTSEPTGRSVMLPFVFVALALVGAAGIQHSQNMHPVKH